jgi:uncharacterized protein YcbX
LAHYRLRRLSADGAALRRELGYVRARSGNGNIGPRRYRPNVVIDSGESEGLIEAEWEGARLEVGGCEILVEARTIRCSIPGRAQAIDGIGADKDVIRAVAEHADRLKRVRRSLIGRIFGRLLRDPEM